MPLKPFQTSDIARAAMHDGVILAWEPGMGKSLAAVAWPLVKNARRTLIVAPGSLHHQLTVSASKFFRVSSFHFPPILRAVGKRRKGNTQRPFS